MNRAGRHDKDLADLDELIESITIDAYGDDEKLWAFRQAFEGEVALPSDGFVIGEPVSVVKIDYDGNVRRGLRARCRREDGSEHVVAASDVVLRQNSSGARHLAAYRKWLGIDPYPAETPAPASRRRQHKVAAEDFDLSRPIDLVALSVKERAARCRLLGGDRVITVRASRLWDVVAGEIVVVRPRKQWRYAGHPYLSGEIESTRIDVAALGLVPPRLEDMGTWDPQAHSWGEEDELIEEWAKPIIARGPRPAYRMERVLPGEDPEDPFADPITESNALRDGGNPMKERDSSSRVSSRERHGKSTEMNHNTCEGANMDVKTLQDTPPWDWPEGAGRMFLDILRDDQAAESDRLLAAELAGDFTVINEELVGALLSILRSSAESETLRGKAAISLGPVLERTDTEGFENPDDPPITERTFHTIQESLRRLYADAGVPTEVRRRILEASVRAPQGWHQDAILAAYGSGDEAWRLTAVFCMRFVRGFDEQILEALDSKNPDIRYEAVCAAGSWAVAAAWPHIAALVTSKRSNTPLLLAAIDAVASIRPQEAPAILAHLTDSDDEDIVEAAYEAMAMAEERSVEDDEDDEFRQ